MGPEPAAVQEEQAPKAEEPAVSPVVEEVEPEAPKLAEPEAVAVEQTLEPAVVEDEAPKIEKEVQQEEAPVATAVEEQQAAVEEILVVEQEEEEAEMTPAVDAKAAEVAKEIESMPIADVATDKAPSENQSAIETIPAQ